MRWQRIRPHQSSLSYRMIAMARMNKSGPLRAARSSSREKQPGVVTFAEAGEHKMRLRVKHVVEEKMSEQPI